MIQRLGSSSLSFKANELTSVRDEYSNQVALNFKIAQKQNDVVLNNAINPMNTQIMMQGNNTQKLDVVA